LLFLPNAHLVHACKPHVHPFHNAIVLLICQSQEENVQIPSFQKLSP
jgi:hypothetical protein